MKFFVLFSVGIVAILSFFASADFAQATHKYECRDYTCSNVGADCNSGCIGGPFFLRNADDDKACTPTGPISAKYTDCKPSICGDHNRLMGCGPGSVSGPGCFTKTTRTFTSLAECESNGLWTSISSTNVCLSAGDTAKKGCNASGQHISYSPAPPPPPPRTLTVSKIIPDAGTVKSNPAGIDCGTACSTQNASFTDGTSMTLEATPIPNGAFKQWLGDCTGTGTCTLTMNAPKNVTAEFAKVEAGADDSIDFGLPRVNTALNGVVQGFSVPYDVEWILVEGDNSNVNILSPNSETTVVEFTASDNNGYVFRFTANDGLAEGSDTVRVKVLNSPPAVSILGSPGARSVEFGFLPITLEATVADDGLPSPPGELTWQWEASGPGTATFTNQAGTATAGTTRVDTQLTLSQAGTYLITLRAEDGELTGARNVEIRYAAPPRFALVPCGVIIDDPATPWDETEDCQLRHTLLLIRNVIDFTLWKLVPLIIAGLVVLTGTIFFFQFGGPEVMAKVRMIWSAVGKGVLILLFSWLFLNFLLGVLGFDINIFGRWYEINA